MKTRHYIFWLAAALVFGVVVLPFLVHATGAAIFGRYGDGGAAQFFGDYLRDLLGLRWYAWTLAVGPAAIVATWLGSWRLAAREA